MNRYGSPGRAGYDARVVVRYLDDCLPPQGHPRWRDAVEGRTVRRWRDQARVTRTALDSILRRCYASSEADFLAWCKAKSIDPTRR